MVTRIDEVPEVLPHVSGVGAGGDEQRGASVSGVVNPQPFLARLGDGGVPHPTSEVGRAERRVVVCHEQQAVLGVACESPDVLA
jgi:hypothetical protein